MHLSSGRKFRSQDSNAYSFSDQFLPERIETISMDERPHDLNDNSKNLVLSHQLDHTFVNKDSVAMEDQDGGLHTTRRSRNAVNLASALPFEILCIVFALVQSFDDDPWDPRTCKWIRVSHVCAYWRSAAINDASLWTYLDFRLPLLLVELFFERSKTAPLSISINSRHEFVGTHPAHAHPEFVTKVMSQMHRIRSLVIRVGCKDVALNALFSEWTGCAPILEVLDLLEEDGELIPHGFLQGGAPQLRQLEFAGRRIHGITLPFSPSITTLSLFQEEEESDPRISKDEFFNVLGLMPALRELRLVCYLPDGDRQLLTRTQRSTPQFAFQCLKTIDVADSISRLTHFLSATRSATVTSINIGYVEVENDNDAYSNGAREVLDGIMNFCNPQSELGMKPPLRQLKLTEEEAEMCFDAYNSNSGTDLRQVSVSFGGFYATATEVLEVLRGHLDVQALESLEYGCDSNAELLDLDDWEFFSRLPKLTAILFERLEPQEFLDLLQETNYSFDLTGATQDVPFPRLSKITLSNTCFSVSVDSLDMDRNMEHSSLFLRTLCAIMRSRSRTAHPISELHLHDAVVEARAPFIQSALPGFDFKANGSNCSFTLRSA